MSLSAATSLLFPCRQLVGRIVSSYSTAALRRFQYPRIDNIENLEKYRLGGYHPVAIGDIFARSAGGYRVVHKLGSGGSSTVWLAQRQDPSVGSQGIGNLITLKILSAEQSSKPESGVPDINISQELNTRHSRLMGHPGRQHLGLTLDHFLHAGPNGTHSQFAGPSILSLCESPGRIAGSKRFRADLSREVAKQAANAVDFLHSAGIVHGDLAPSNVLMRISDEVHEWSDDSLYQYIGSPETDDVLTQDGSPLDPAAPEQVVAPVDNSHFYSLLEESVIVIDFGQAFLAGHPPPDYKPATPLSYLSPEAYFDEKVGFASDIWALACLILEIRAGAPLFDNFLGDGDIILSQVIETLGRLPEPWWSLWEAKKLWFYDDSEPKPETEQESMLVASKTSLRRKLREIGVHDSPPERYEGNMFEPTGMRLKEAEVELLEDLLEKMLRYHPEDRLAMKDVVQHPWFKFSG